MANGAQAEDDRTAPPKPDRAISDLPELTAARGFAALVVVLFHVDKYGGQPLQRWFPVEQLGMLAVDFFFVLSGFVLTHVYGAAWTEGGYSHRDFLVRRFARIWPMHVACLLAVGAIVAVGALIGIRPPWSVEASSFIGHVLMLNATGLWPDLSWNQPAWSIGAEWTAYLLFPLYLAACGAIRSGWAKLAAAVCILVALHALVRATMGQELLALDADGGLLRIVPSFFAGVALRQIYGRRTRLAPSARTLAAMLLATLACGLTLIALHAPAIVTWFALPMTIYLLALRAARPELGVLKARPLIWLGEVSYGLYLVHAPVLMVTFGVAGKLFGVGDPAALIAIGCLGAALSLGAAAIGHRLIERPAQAFILAMAKAWVRGSAPAATTAAYEKGRPPGALSHRGADRFDQTE